METNQSLLSYCETTEGVKVTVYPQYLSEESNPRRSLYSFAYTVSIENFRSESIQLLRRHWIVNSGGMLFAEVKGDGVVGEQPLIAPGESYRYTSGSIIEHAVGSMHGVYFFQTEQGEELEISIPEFDLVFPEFIH